jgi:chromosome segregation ATPase
MGVAALASIGATWISIKKFLSANIASITTDKAHVDLINYLKEARQIAHEAEEKYRERFKQIEIENSELKAKLTTLEAESTMIKGQNAMLTDIITSLQLSLSQTKKILEEQIEMNNELIKKISQFED